MLKRASALMLFAVLAGCSTAPATEEIGKVEGAPAGAFKNVPGTSTYNRAKRHYDNGRYWQALHDYKSAARWADKPAQFNVAAMYFNGEGTDVDRARAWAWFQLAAERRYPQMVEMARRVDAIIDASERAEAEKILREELLPVYGDAVAIDRTALRMRQDQQRLRTGSRVGDRTENVVIYAPGVDPRKSAPHSARNLDSTDFWDFHQLVDLEVSLYDGQRATTVDLRDFEIIDSGQHGRAGEGDAVVGESADLESAP